MRLVNYSKNVKSFFFFPSFFHHESVVFLLFSSALAGKNRGAWSEERRESSLTNEGRPCEKHSEAIRTPNVTSEVRKLVLMLPQPQGVLNKEVADRSQQNATCWVFFFLLCVY